MSCLFNSLSLLLKDELSQQNITNLRLFLCDYIITHKHDLLKNEDIGTWILYSALDRGLSFDAYITEMRKSHTWGGAPEIALVSKLFNVDIEIYNTQNQCISVFQNHNGSCYKTIKLYYNGNHYTYT